MPFHLLSLQCLCRVSERLEEAGVQNARMEDIVLEQFLALAEGHYVQRVEPPNTELVTISYLDQRARGGSTVRVRQRFELPPAVTEGVFLCVWVCVCVSACLGVCVWVCGCV